MALGGGTFTAMNKVLPGVYVNAQSTDLATLENSERGILAYPMAMRWGKENEVITVTADDLADDIKCLKIFGYTYSDDEMKPIRESFKGATKMLLYRVNSGTQSVFNYISEKVGNAKHSGTRGDKLSVVIDNSSETITTYLAGTKVAEDTFSAETTSYDNDFVEIDLSKLKSETATASDTEAETTVASETIITLTGEGGTDGVASGETVTAFTAAIESYSYNVLCCPFTDNTIQDMLIAFTKRARADLGLNAQVVIYGTGRSVGINDESVVALNNDQTNAIYWVSGQLAGVQVGDSLTGLEYDGEYSFKTNYTKSELEKDISNGIFVIHNVNGTARVLKDINTLTEYTERKNKLFSDNATIRVVDRISNDVGVVFSKYVYGKTKNNDLGRTLLKSDIYDVLAEIAATQAIEAVDLEDIEVAYADKNAVSVTLPIVLVGTIDQIYITVSVA